MSKSLSEKVANSDHTNRHASMWFTQTSSIRSGPWPIIPTASAYIYALAVSVLGFVSTPQPFPTANPTPS